MFRSSLRRLLLAFTLLAVSSWALQPAHGAKGSSPFMAAGTVQAVDLKTKTITLQRETSKAVLQLTWNRQTRFYAGSQRVQPEALKPATQVKFEYFVPLFGRPYLTEIKW